MTSVELDPAVVAAGAQIFRHQRRAEFPARQPRRPALPAGIQGQVRHHPDRRLSRALRAVPSADQGILSAGQGPSRRGRRGGAECRAVDHAVRFRGEDDPFGLSASSISISPRAMSSPSPMTARRARPTISQRIAAAAPGGATTCAIDLTQMLAQRRRLPPDPGARSIPTPRC